MCWKDLHSGLTGTVSGDAHTHMHTHSQRKKVMLDLKSENLYCQHTCEGPEPVNIPGVQNLLVRMQMVENVPFHRDVYMCVCACIHFCVCVCVCLR